MRYLANSSSCSSTVLAVVISVLLATAGLSCGDESKNCTEKCSSDDDCMSDLACMDTSSGSMCLPKDCRTCFENNLNCSHTPVDEASKGDVCEFVRCN